MKTIVLNIPKNTQRLTQFTADYPAFLPTFQVWPAKTGTEVILPKWWKRSENRFANVQNRIDILTANMDTVEPILFCEDDCIFAEDFEQQFQETMAHIPDDWDMVYWGGLHPSDGMFVPEQVNAFILRCRYTIFTHCLSIRETAIPKLLSQLDLTHDWTGTHAQDCRIAELHRQADFHAYAPMRFIAGQRGDIISDLNQTTRQNDHYFNSFAYRNLEGKLTRMED